MTHIGPRNYKWKPAGGGGVGKVSTFPINGTDVCRIPIPPSSCLKCGLDAWSCDSHHVVMRNKYERKKLSQDRGAGSQNIGRPDGSLGSRSNTSNHSPSDFCSVGSSLEAESIPK